MLIQALEIDRLEASIRFLTINRSINQSSNAKCKQGRRLLLRLLLRSLADE